MKNDNLLISFGVAIGSIATLAIASHFIAAERGVMMIEWLEKVFMLEPWKSLLTFAGAMAIAWVTVKLALGRYKNEKLWERQIGIYADLIESLTVIQRSAKAQYELLFDQDGQLMQGAKPDWIKEAEEKLHKRSGEAGSKLSTAISYASLFLGASANKILTDWTDEREGIDSDFEHGVKDISEAYDALETAASNALDRLKADAKLVIKNH
jgi:hypothetical protein